MANGSQGFPEGKEIPDVERVSQAVTKRTGLVFPPAREGEMINCLLQSFRESSRHATFEEYLQHLEEDRLERREMRALISRLTVGETYFFRIRPHFDLLRDTILPRLIHKRARTTRTLRLWSAGCSTGEEPYSLAILLRETVPQISRWNIFILATDISEEALDLAQAGEYRDWSFREVAPLVRDRYFTRVTSGWKLNPEIRSMITFRYLNLMEDVYPLASTGTNFMDIIMCRNVMIYFQPMINTVITRRFYRALNNEGYLIVGHTEHTDFIYRGFRKLATKHTIVYEKEEKWSQWDRGLTLRFRGSGSLPPGTVPIHPPPKAAPAVKITDPRFQKRRETQLFEEGAAAYGEGKIKIAVSRFREVLGINPGNHRACYMLALLEANANHLHKAEELCLQAIENFPLSLEAHYLLAIIYREGGDRARELEYLKKTVYINSRFILGHYQLGVYYLKEGNITLSRKFFGNAMKLLERWDEKDYIEGAEGMTVGLLRETIRRDLAELDGDHGAQGLRTWRE